MEPVADTPPDDAFNGITNDDDIGAREKHSHLIHNILARATMNDCDP